MPSTSRGPKNGRTSLSKGPRTKLGYDTCHYHFVFYVRINSVTWCIQHFCWGTQHVGWNGKNVLHPNINKAAVSSVRHTHPSFSSSYGLLLPLLVPTTLRLPLHMRLLVRLLFLRCFFFLSLFMFMVVPCGSSSSSTFHAAMVFLLSFIFFHFLRRYGSSSSSPTKKMTFFSEKTPYKFGSYGLLIRMSFFFC